MHQYCDKHELFADNTTGKTEVNNKTKNADMHNRNTVAETENIQLSKSELFAITLGDSFRLSWQIFSTEENVSVMQWQLASSGIFNDQLL